MNRIVLCRCAALIAAYVIALQAVLTAFAVTIPAAGPGFEICRSGGVGTPSQPQSHDHDQCGACLAGHCAGAAASPDRIAGVIRWPVAGEPVENSSTVVATLPVASREQPHSPRAPPTG